MDSNIKNGDKKPQAIERAISILYEEMGGNFKSLRKELADTAAMVSEKISKKEIQKLNDELNAVIDKLNKVKELSKAAYYKSSIAKGGASSSNLEIRQAGARVAFPVSIVNFTSGVSLNPDGSVTITPVTGQTGITVTFPPVTTNPTTPTVGQGWYNTTTNKVQFYDGAVVRDLYPIASSGATIQSLVTDPASPTTGQVWYNTTSNILKYYNGTTVVPITAGASSSTYHRENHTALTGTTIVLSMIPSFGVQVHKNGVLLHLTDQYTISGGTVTLVATPPVSSDVYSVTYWTGTSGGYFRETFSNLVSSTITVVNPITGQIQVYKNGVLLHLTDQYTISGQAVSLLTAPILTDKYTIINL